MRFARVLNHGVPAGVLEELADGGFCFTYEPQYLSRGLSGISLTLPARTEPYHSRHLFAFFAGLLAEGPARKLQERVLKVDERDDFGLLLATGQDVIGSVGIEPGDDR